MTGSGRWDFVLALHRAASADPARTLCWSPYSVAAALGVAADAARGATRDELLTALTGGPDAAACARLLGLAADLGDGAELAVACSAWLRADATVADGFTGALARWPGAALRTFGADLEQARRAINADVAESTRGLVPELLGTPLHPQALALLVSALYLRTGWTHRFDGNATRPRGFHAPGGAVQAPTMELVADLGYADTGRWQVVALPAAGGVEATVLLPHGPLGPAEAALDGAELDELFAAHPSRRVRLRLPRLRVGWGDDLTDALRRIGVRTLFDPRHADLGGLTPVRPAWVSQVSHRSVLRVDENGLEAAAATAMVVAGRALGAPPAEPLLVEVDRPFLVAVRHRRTGSVYFLARVTHPRGQAQS